MVVVEAYDQKHKGFVCVRVWVCTRQIQKVLYVLRGSFVHLGECTSSKHAILKRISVQCSDNGLNMAMLLNRCT